MALLTVVWREIVERRLCFAAAALLGLAPFVASLAWGLEGDDLRTAWKWTAFVSAGALGAVLAVAIGVTLYPVAPSDQRLGFFLSRPIRPASLWVGKMLGATAVLLGCVALVVAPTWVAVGGDEGSLTFSVGIEARTVAWWLQPVLDLVSSYSHRVFTIDASAVAVTAALVPATHIITLIARSRSLWLLIDIAAATAIALGWSWVFDSLFDIEPLRHYWLSVATLSFVTGAYAGSAASVVLGRTSLRAARRSLTPVLWTTSCSGFAVMAAWVAWIMTSTVGDMDQIYGAKPAPRGNWVALLGNARGATSTFLHDPTTGCTLRVGVGYRRSSLPQISGNGRTAVWSRKCAEGFELVLAHLDAPDPRPTRTGVLFDHHMNHVTFSPSDRRFATVTGDRLFVYDIESNEIVGGSRLPGANWHTTVAFHGEDDVQVYRAVDTGRRECRLAISDFDIESESLMPKATSAGSPCRGSFRLLASVDGNRLLSFGVWDGNAELIDPEDGSSLATLHERRDRARVTAGFLHDGGVAVVAEGADEAVLRLFSPEGAPQRSLTFATENLILGCETSPGLLAIGVGKPDTYRWEEPTLMLVDLVTGETRTIAEGLGPACFLFRNLWADWGTRPEPGSPATHLFYGRNKDTLVRFDPETGERVVVVGRAQ